MGLLVFVRNQLSEVGVTGWFQRLGHKNSLWFLSLLLPLFLALSVCLSPSGHLLWGGQNSCPTDTHLWRHPTAGNRGLSSSCVNRHSAFDHVLAADSRETLRQNHTVQLLLNSWATGTERQPVFAALSHWVWGVICYWARDLYDSRCHEETWECRGSDPLVYFCLRNIPKRGGEFCFTKPCRDLGSTLPLSRCVLGYVPCSSVRSRLTSHVAYVLTLWEGMKERKDGIFLAGIQVLLLFPFHWWGLSHRATPICREAGRMESQARQSPWSSGQVCSDRRTGRMELGGWRPSNLPCPCPTQCRHLLCDLQWHFSKAGG